MDVLYKTFPSQNNQPTWALPAHCTVKLQIWIWKTQRMQMKNRLIRNALNFFWLRFIFKLRQNTYNLKNVQAFESQNPRTKKFDVDSIA